MPRTARITLDNACYHIITRGNQKQIVFTDTTDYERYISLLAKYKKSFSFKLYGFCLMPNHVHLLIEVRNHLLVQKIMRGLNLSYTLYFNFRHNKVGHLWQDRFKSKIIEQDAYFLECLNYVETNPVRAQLVERLENYRWSSYIYRTKKNRILDSIFSI